MTSKEIRERFLNYFKSRGHVIVPSSSLIPDDPSVLLTTAGMQQFKKYYMGEADPERDFGSRNTVSIQKSFRTSDIDEVGDESHLTFFEMLGNFSFGGYGKKEAITLAHEFITKEMRLPISYATIFEGSSAIPKDEESLAAWNELGVTDVREQGMDDVFWGPTGTSGPCGPTTEIYCRNCDGKEIEVWNIVFNHFLCTGSRDELIKGTGSLQPLSIQGIDTGMGLERLAMISQVASTIFETDLFAPLISGLPASMATRVKRIFVDHCRAIVFLLAEGVRPSNKDRGYILRRLIRRVIVQEHMANSASYSGVDILGTGRECAETLRRTIELYRSYYPELDSEIIFTEFEKERGKFGKTLQQGLRELSKMGVVDAAGAFKLYESFGLPYEIIKEIGGVIATQLTREAFDEEFRKHQEISRAGVEKKFGGHGLLLDTGELKAKDEYELGVVTRLHTATHLLQQALRIVLGQTVAQRGSDITAERTRFDFSFDRKLTLEEVKRVEALVNDVIRRDLPVQRIELPIEEAKKTGALYFFREKYPELVNVYYVGSSLADAFSREFCGGPHVLHTGEIGGITIVKEEACSAGVRRIRAMLQNSPTTAPSLAC